MLTAFLVKHLKLCCLNYNDDRFGVTIPSLATEEKDTVLRVCFCLGVKVSDKTIAGQVINILGVAFDFRTGLIGIKEERRDDLLAQLESILSANELHQGVGSKLRGKLLFLAVTSRAAMVVHTLHRSPTGSTRAVLTSASPRS